MKSRNFLIAFFVFVSLFASAYAQDTKVSAFLDSSVFKVGDHIKIHLLFQSNQKVNVIMPQIPDTIQNIEIIFKAPIDTIIKNGIYQLSTYIVSYCF